MKLIVADLDGTLINKKVMSDQTKKTILNLQEKGIAFTLATGRHKDATRNLVKALNIHLPVICTNGASIYDFDSDIVIHQDNIEKETVKLVLSILDKHQVDYLIYTNENIVSTVEAKEKLHKRIGDFDSIVSPKNSLDNYLELGVLKVLVIENNNQILNQVKQELGLISDIYLLQSQPAFLDIGSKRASKGRALEILSTYLNISLNETLAIGDQENDLSMIQTAKIGVAMGNAEDILKQKASFITKTIDEEGFTHAINMFVFKPKR